MIPSRLLARGKRFPRAFLLPAALALAGCAATPLPGSEVAQIGGTPVELTQVAGPEPTVVFVSGISGTNAIWKDVFPVIARDHATFAYHRPGYGDSPRNDAPRDGATIVARLRAILDARSIARPVILVGHSAGGLYSQLYARRYPGEVAGMVLLDPVHPTQFEGEGAVGNRSPFYPLLLEIIDLTSPITDELDAITETGQQVLAAPPLPAKMPVVILVAPDPAETEAARFDNAKRRDYARLYPNADWRAVESGHSIQADRPELVIEAIREVLARAGVAPTL